MANRIYESMTRVEVYEHKNDRSTLLYVVRVWCREKEFNWRDASGPRMDIENALGLLPPSPRQIAEALDAIPDVSAYEILDADGNGAIVYPDWP